MPRISLWFIRISFLYFACAMLLAAICQFIPPDCVYTSSSSVHMTYVHMLTVGWLTQLIFGVSHWMFPQPKGDMIPGYSKLPASAFLLLNAGLLLRILIEPAQSSGNFEASWQLLVLAGVLQLGGSLAFTVSIWPRIRGK